MEKEAAAKPVSKGKSSRAPRDYGCPVFMKKKKALWSLQLKILWNGICTKG
jgi:hypothetical protein